MACILYNLIAGILHSEYFSLNLLILYRKWQRILHRKWLIIICSGRLEQRITTCLVYKLSPPFWEGSMMQLMGYWTLMSDQLALVFDVKRQNKKDKTDSSGKIMPSWRLKTLKIRMWGQLKFFFYRLLKGILFRGWFC